MLYDFGLDPCADIGGTSIIYMLPHIIFEYTGADALAYILERGADPNHVESDGEGIFDTLDFDADFGALEMYSRRRYDAFLHSWIVLIGYGAKPSTLKEDIEILDFIDRENTEEQKKRFRDHRNYYFGLTHFPEKGENWTLHIFDRRSMYEVARL